MHHRCHDGTNSKQNRGTLEGAQGMVYKSVFDRWIDKLRLCRSLLPVHECRETERAPDRIARAWLLHFESDFVGAPNRPKVRIRSHRRRSGGTPEGMNPNIALTPYGVHGSQPSLLGWRPSFTDVVPAMLEVVRPFEPSYTPILTNANRPPNPTLCNLENGRLGGLLVKKKVSFVDPA